jgi:hypothetical protein
MGERAVKQKAAGALLFVGILWAAGAADASSTGQIGTALYIIQTAGALLLMITGRFIYGH